MIDQDLLFKYYYLKNNKKGRRIMDMLLFSLYKVNFMKIVMIKPKYPNGHQSGRLGNKITRWSYFTSLLVVASLFPDSCQIEYFDEDYEEIHFLNDVDYVFITSLTYSAPRAYEIADAFREMNIPVIMGGIHASQMIDEALEHVDSVLVGEAESIFDELYEDLKTGNLKKLYKSTNPVTAEKISGLDRRLLLKKPYFKNKIVSQLVRGCPCDCSFCSVTKFFGNKYRFRNLDDVIDEIKFQLDRSNSRMVSFLDDNIFSQKAISKEFLRKLIPLKVQWWSQGPLNVADDEEMLQLMKDSGCVCLFVGIEDITKSGLESVNKKINKIEKYEQQIENLHKMGIMVMAGFIFGLDTQDSSVFQEVIDFIQKMKIELPFFSILTPYPGTEIYKQFSEENRIISKDWTLYDHSHVVFQPKNMTIEELQEGFGYVMQEAYSLERLDERLSKLSYRHKLMMKPFLSNK